MDFECVINSKGKVAIFSRPLGISVEGYILVDKSLTLISKSKSISIVVPDLFRKCLERERELLLVECKDSHTFSESILKPVQR
jgi:hypothetical protein